MESSLYNNSIFFEKMFEKRQELKEKYTVTLCSSKNDSYLLWTPKAIIRCTYEDSKREDFPMEWNETFFSKGKANDYALKNAKDWISRNTGIKNVFTQQEWADERFKRIFISFVIIFFISMIVISVI